MKKKLKTNVFLVDDDPLFLKVMETQFKDQTYYNIHAFSTGEECLKNLSQKPDIIFLDYYLNTTKSKADNGLAILDKIKAFDPKIQVIMLSSQDSMSIAINCLRHDAFDYIVKSEAAFVRAQKAISSLLLQIKLKKELILYKTVGIIAFSAILILLSLLLIT